MVQCHSVATISHMTDTMVVSMYCPKCMNPSLQLSSSGVVNVVINKKQMDAGRFLFNLNSHRKEQIIKDFENKLEEFFNWYASFQNPEPITQVSLTSGDFACENGCRLDINSKFSIVDVLIPKKIILNKLNALGEKHRLQIRLDDDF